jgi:hypothetical protein
MDIVERLRKQTMPEDVNRLWAERNEAAAEIKRLRAESKHWQTIASQGVAIERELLIEIERLRKEKGTAS